MTYDMHRFFALALALAGAAFAAGCQSPYYADRGAMTAGALATRGVCIA